MIFIYAEYIKMGLDVKVINNGGRIIEMKTKKGKLADGTIIYPTLWRDCWAFMQLPLKAFPSTFGLRNMTKGTFPFLLLEKATYHKTFDEFPALKYFSVNTLSSEERREVKEWHLAQTLRFAIAKQIGRPLVYSVDKEVEDYCKNDVSITKWGCLRYSKIMESITGFNPFLNARSIASFALFVFRMNHLQKKTLVHLPEAGYNAHEHHSAEAETYFAWLEQQRGRKLKHYSNDGEEWKIEFNKERTYRVDCFDQITSEVIEWHACWNHGCEKCIVNRNEKHPLSGNTADEDFFRTERKASDIRKIIGEDGQPKYKYTEVWSHELPELFAQNPGMEQFFKDYKYVGRLRPREALQGGRTGTLRLLWNQEKDGGVFHLVDVKSL